ncbi:MAG: AAA family ATPase [Verrucomicrobiota bacterium]|jgi:DNA repair exonuclease SbcCD ATPase subunit
MKLKSLRLENFRCFQKAEFDLDAEVIAIYGRNGVGKTAVFDGVEFALLGSIGRYTREIVAPDFLPCRFGEGDVRVRVDFSDNPRQWIQMNRSREKHADWSLSGSATWRTNGEFLLDFLLDSELSPARRQIEPAAEYVRSTLLLSQDSIRKFVEAESAKRAAILAYLAGVGAVQRRLEKAGGVLEEAKREERKEQQRADEAKRLAEELGQLSAEKEGRISAIREQVAGQQVTQESLKSALQHAGITLDLPVSAMEDGDSLSSVVRGICSERIASCETRLNLLTEIAAMSKLHASRLQQSRQLLVDMATAKTRQQALLTEENTAAAKFQALEREIGELEPDISRQKVSVDLLIKLQSLQSQQRELDRILTAAEKAQQAVHDDLIALRTSFEKLDVDLKSIPSNDVAFHERSERALAELLSLEVLPQEVPGFRNLIKTALDQTLQMHTLDKAIGALLPSKMTFELQLGAAVQRTAEMNRLVAQSKTSVEEVASLAARLRQHVTSKDCPLCGHAHPSITDLQKAIDERLSQVPAALTKASTDLEAAMREKAILAALVGDNKTRLEEWQTSLQDARQQRENVQRTIGAVLERKNQAVIGYKNLLQILQGEIRALRTEGSQQPIPNDLSARLLTEQSQLALLEGKKAEKSGVREGARNQLSSIHNERMAVEQSIGRWQELAAQLTAEIQDYRTKCGPLGLAEDTPPDALTSVRQRVSEEITLIQLAQRTAESYALSRKLTSLEKEQNQTRPRLEEAEKTVVQIGKRRQALEEAGREIESWIKLLSAQVSRAVADRITAHRFEINGFFKAMIPTPYLFEEITMDQVEDGLKLGLRYRGQEEDVGEPQFFLSNAQANVLALSLFLSFTRAQRWAKLETILLDDPVQHLDDLDAVAFLDTLRSVALGGLGPRKQVIVSTCDQNLYLLMIRKFGMLESMGLRFTAISLLDRGEAGPEIIYDIGGPSGKRYLREAV